MRVSAAKKMMKPEQVINQDPDIHGGTPVFTGTRVPIQSLIDHLKAGDSLDYFLEGFPSVSREQAIAFLEFALMTAIGSHLRSDRFRSPDTSGQAGNYNKPFDSDSVCFCR